MKLSACYIVGENERYLEKSLQSIEKLVSEILIVDTTSGKDKTIRSLAGKYHAKYYSFIWQENFSLARNYAIEKASGDWIIFLDADEYFGEYSEIKIKQEIAKGIKEKKDVLLVKLYNFETENVIMDYFWAPRFFKREKSIRYHGAIHEQLVGDHRGLRTGFIEENVAVVHHLGYFKTQAKEKAQRNLQMLQKEIVSTKDPEQFYMYLAEAYQGIGDLLQAEKYARMDIEQGRQAISYASRSYRILLGILETAEPANRDELVKILKRACKDFPELPEFHAELAQYLASEKCWSEAVLAMTEALFKAEDYQGIEPSFFDEDAKRAAQKLLIEWKKKLENEKKIKLSACVIVKNEETEIGRWIENMQQIADELIIVDTGSTDQTKEIIVSYGIDFHEYCWNNDFAAAKNYAIEKATGNWIAFLDADQYFAQDSLANVRNVLFDLENNAEETDAVMCTVINIDVDQANIELGRVVELRLFHRNKYLRYHGSIHESIRHSKRNLKIVVEKNLLKIYHTGYSTKRVQEKAKRNLSLLEKEIEKFGEQPRHYRYLLDCYHVLGEHQKAVKYGKLQLSFGELSFGLESQVYMNLINSMIFAKYPEIEIQFYIKEAIMKYPELPDFYACMAGSEIRSGNLLAAKPFFLKALEVYHIGFSSETEASNIIYMLTEIYTNLAKIADQEGNAEEKTEYVKKALDQNKYNEDAFFQMYDSIKNQSIGERKKILFQWYQDTKEDLLFVTSMLENISIDDLYVHYVSVLQEKCKFFHPRHEFYKKIKTEKESALDYALQYAARQMEMIVDLSVSSKEVKADDSLDKILPNSLYHCMKQIFNETESDEDLDIDAYKTFLGILSRRHPQAGDFWEVVLRPAKQLPAKEILEITDIFYRNKCYDPCQFILDSKELFELSGNREEFYLQAGISLYYCKEYQLAECFLMKIQGDDLLGAEATCYRAWLS